MAVSDDGETDFENTSASVDVLSEPDPKLDEKVLYLIGRVAIIRQLLDEETPFSSTTIRRLKRLKALVNDLPLPSVVSKKVGFEKP